MRTIVIVGAVVVLAAGAFLLGRVGRAAGPPTTQPLWYAGFLERDETPVDGPVGLAVNLWDAEVDGNQVCSRAAMETQVQKGRFRVALPDACVAAVQANPNLWVEVVVGGTEFLPRSKLSAVPFAIEAQNASAAVGALDSRIAAVERPIYAQNSKQYPLHGKYCGVTSTNYNGALTGAPAGNGYTGAKALCEAVAGCSSTTARMCTAEELLRHVTTGGTFTNSMWYATGSVRYVWNSATMANEPLADCTSFTSAATNVRGSYWHVATSPSVGFANQATCNAVTIAIACCD